MDRDKLSVLAVSDSGFIFDPVTGHSYTANATGLKILELLKAGKELDEIKSALTDEFDASEDEVSVDINDFIENLKKYFLI
ncbi:MAG: PqqD family protein [Candidatus Delongbacteria bacterium]|nr:PqqD family protein [Candidatus Delongbacteria bacterium]MCG2760255.1 PqqD family protein [Candidatus Delongbacteria bacterium]